MSEIILPPNQPDPELPEEQLPEIKKPTDLSKLIEVKFNPLNTHSNEDANTRQSFYTTDTDAWITLEVQDMNEPTGAYSLVLHNMDDGSLFQRTGDLVIGKAYYKLKEEEIKHAGRWAGQVVITLDNGQTTTSKFRFIVTGHMLDGKDIRQIVIEDFQTLMKQLNDLKNDAEIDFDNLKNSVVEAQKVAKENEAERQENETIRLNNETARVEAEEVRKSDEATRQTNETNRVASFNSYDDRVKNLETDTVIKATNLIPIKSFIANAYANSSSFRVELKKTNKYYIRRSFIVNNGGTNAISGQIRFEQPIILIQGVATIGTAGTIYEHITDTRTNYLTMYGADSADSNGIRQSTFSDVMCLNLTETFGVGNEPTATQMDRLLTQFPNSWFDGTRNLFLAKWALNEMRRLDNEKANRKQEDWITPVLSNGATGTIKFRKNNFGELEFKGTLKSIEGVNSLIFPQGYIVPSSVNVTLPTVSNAPTLRNVLFQSSGGTYFGTPYGSAEVSLEGLILPL